MTTFQVGECEQSAKALLRACVLPANAEVAILNIARYADELARRLDHIEEEVCGRPVPPIPLQQLERQEFRPSYLRGTYTSP